MSKAKTKKPVSIAKYLIEALNKEWNIINARENFLIKYAISALSVLVLLGFVFNLSNSLIEGVPFLLIMLAALISTWLGGIGPGLFATLLTTIVTEIFFIPPYGRLFGLERNSRIALFLLEGFIISFISALRKQVVEEQTRLSLIVEQSDDAIIGKDLDGKITSWNLGAEKLYGYSAYEVLGKSETVLLTKGQLSKYKTALKAVQKGKSVDRFESIHLNKEGQRIDVAMTIFPIKNTVNKVVATATIIRNITNRKKLEADLKRSRDQLEIIFQNVADAITVQDSNGKLIYANNHAALLYGYTTQKELINALNNPDAIKSLQDRFEIKSEEGNVLNYDDLPSKQVFEGSEYAESTINFINRETNTSLWYLIKSKPIMDKNEKVQFVVNIITDFTERKKLEKRKDDFISIASHELKTPLTTIKGFTQIAQKNSTAESDPKLANYLHIIDSQTDRLTKLVNDLLDVSKIQAGKLELIKEVINYDELINKVVNNFHASYPDRKIAIEGKTNKYVQIDKYRIEQVIANLISNALKFSPPSKEVKVILGHSKTNVTLTVEDKGIGIPPEDLPHVFDRFFQAGNQKNVTAVGLGLGLHISNKIIKEHGGKIRVESAINKGTRFFVTLPQKAKM